MPIRNQSVIVMQSQPTWTLVRSHVEIRCQIRTVPRDGRLLSVECGASELSLVERGAEELSLVEHGVATVRGGCLAIFCIISTKFSGRILAIPDISSSIEIIKIHVGLS